MVRLDLLGSRTVVRQPATFVVVIRYNLLLWVQPTIGTVIPVFVLVLGSHNMRILPVLESYPIPLLLTIKPKPKPKLTPELKPTLDRRPKLRHVLLVWECD